MGELCHHVSHTNARPRCPQPDTLNNTADFGPHIPFPDCGQDDLDCLNLNVIAPKDVNEPLPVFFWIHG
jgi:carboxylesterase type B